MPEIPNIDPLKLFSEWFADAQKAEEKYPEVMQLATVDASGMPDVRAVLLKDFDEKGFVFYTNTRSSKGTQLGVNGKAAVNFYWKSTDRQIRIRGTVTPVTPQEADEYFATRPRLSQLGAWASHQSEEIASRAVLEERLKEVEHRYQGQDVPRPPHWSGYRIAPISIEFWSEGAFRLHDRRLFTATSTGWKSVVLSP